MSKDLLIFRYYSISQIWHAKNMQNFNAKMIRFVSNMIPIGYPVKCFE